jgi:GGDEF domain-containing protein
MRKLTVMQLDSLELQIFLGLVVVLGAAFVALLCDFLKGNNEQLRERNIELRVRQNERDRAERDRADRESSERQSSERQSSERERFDRAGILDNPMQWIQALAQALRAPTPVPTPAEATAGGEPVAHREWSSAQAGGGAPAADPFVGIRKQEAEAEPAAAANDGPPVRRKMYDEMKARTQQAGGTWASKEEMEALAERAARIRARHESQRAQPEPSPVAEPAVEPVAEHAAAPVAEQVPPPVAEQLPPPVAEQLPLKDPPAVDQPAVEALEAAAEALAPAGQVPSAPPPALLADESSPRLRLVPIGDMPSAEAEAEPEAKSVISFAATETAWVYPRPEPGAPRAVAPDPSEPLPPPAPPLSEAEAEDRDPQAELARLRVLPIDMNSRDQPEPSEASQATALASRVVEPPAPSADTARLPTGLQEASVLRRLMETVPSFSGVVVAIGINDFASLKEKLSTNTGSDSMAALNRMIQSMLRPQDFACLYVEDEYILVYPDESGASAQRRLFQVSEKLWDFQLRSLGHLSVMFSWGGLEVQGESLQDAVSSARDRMYQTRRTRKPNSADTGVRKRVANG